MNVRRILVPVDFSPGSHAAVQYARGIAMQFGSFVHVLHAAQPGATPPWSVEFGDSGPSPTKKVAQMDALHHLAALMVVERLDPFHSTGVVRLGRPDDVITRYADEIHADLIVMGLHGDHLAGSSGMGEIVERVLDRAQCPVLAVPEQRAGVMVEPMEAQALAS